MKSCRLFATTLAVAVASPVFASAPAFSNFDSGPDGWTFPASTEWRATGGNADGHLFGGIPEDANITAGAFAPAAFLGDWSALDGVGSISFDYKRFDNGQNPLGFLPLTIQIVGPGGNATWNGPIINTPGDWTTYTAPINQANWSIDDGNWNDILANVAIFYIQLELVINAGPLDDTAGLDNVSLIPSPATIGLLSLGLLGTRRRR